MPHWPQNVFSIGNCVNGNGLKPSVHPPLLHFEETRKTRIETIGIQQFIISDNFAEESILPLMQPHYEMNKNVENKAKAIGVELHQCSSKKDLNLCLRRKSVNIEINGKLDIEFNPFTYSTCTSSCVRVHANSKKNISGPGINMLPRPNEIVSDEKCDPLIKCNEKFAAIKHHNLDSKEKGAVIEMIKSTGSDFHAQLQSNAKKNTADPSELNIYVSVYRGNNRAIMMGYPMIKIYNQKSNEVNNESITDLINSLCSSIKRKRKINTEQREKIIDDLRNGEYDLTLKTIEGSKLKANNLQTLQNFLRELIDINESIRINSETCTKLRGNVMANSADIIHAKSTEDREIEHLATHIQPKDAMNLIIQPRPQDILCSQGGRGSKAYDHDGNKWYRSYIAKHKVIYTYNVMDGALTLYYSHFTRNITIVIVTPTSKICQF